MTTFWNRYVPEDKSLKRILEKCASYIGNDQYVYKKCSNDMIVVLKKTDKTITNETRSSVIDPKYAKFRGNVFEVVHIFNAFNCDNEYTEASSCYEKDFHYKLGHIVEVKNLDHIAGNICSTGIHYFKDIRGAYYYDSSPPAGFTGQWFVYYDNGQTWYEYNYVNGKLEGKFIEWSANGQMLIKRNFEDNKLKGESIVWDATGRVTSKLNYINGIPYIMAP